MPVSYTHLENIDIDKEGKDILIGFNPRFLIDALKVIDDETISIYPVSYTHLRHHFSELYPKPSA